MRKGLLLLLAASAYPATLEENRAVIRKAAALLENDDDNLGKLLFIRRRETKEFESDGKEKFKNSTTTRREPYEDLVITRVIARNDQPLSAEEMKKQGETIKANVDAYRQHIAQEGSPKPPPRKKENEDIHLLREMPEALDYKLAGAENRAGRQVDIYEFSLRPGYSPKSFKFRLFEKVRGKCWVDRETSEFVELFAEAFDNVSVGFGVLGRIGKGTQFRLQRTEAAPGVWVTALENYKFDVRVMLVKSIRREMDTRLSEFQLRPAKQETTARK